MSALQTPNPATALCTSCGLCCDGSIHGHAGLREDEVEAAAAIELPLLTDGRRGFAMPCPKLIDRCCTIYVLRPAACRGYKCQLL